MSGDRTTKAAPEMADVLRATEAALSESEDRFRAMADFAPVLLWMAGTDGLCNFFNTTWLRFTGRPLEREVGNGWAEGIHFEDFQRCMTLYMTSFTTRQTFAMEYRLRRADGQYRWIYDQGTPRFAPDETFLGFIGSCVDVTERREAEEARDKLDAVLEERVCERTAALSAALEEREVLLREVHHRVKNNLQIVSSLMNIQARGLDARSRAALEDCQSRVHTIALIHGALYDAKNLANVSFSSYLRDLATNVLRATGGKAISLEVKCDDVQLPIAKAIPCGLIVNELMTNAIKHAFPGGRSGTIRLELKEEGRQLVVSVRDDGVGLPAGLDYKSAPSMGLQLISMLSEQLDATLAVERDVGTTFRISFDPA